MYRTHATSVPNESIRHVYNIWRLMLRNGDIGDVITHNSKDGHIMHSMQLCNDCTPGLLEQLKEGFTCQICRSTIVPPVIFACCCKSIIGCQVCIDQWYQGVDGMARSFPICRFERAFTETTVLHGLNDFFETITPLLGSSQPDDPQQEDN